MTAEPETADDGPTEAELIQQFVMWVENDDPRHGIRTRHKK